MVDRNIEDQQYYHGLLPRADIKAMLRLNGDFLVRTTEPTSGQARQFVLSVMHDETREEAGIKHFVIVYNNPKFAIDKYSFFTIPELINYHVTHPNDSVTKTQHVTIKTPVLRQPWELAHEDIEVTKKLGEGAFGEVSLGVLRLRTGAKVNVAIKLAKLEAMTKEQIKEIMAEARLMRMFDHPHVVRLYGVAAGREPLMIVMELADGGSLDGYLRKHQLPINNRIEMCMGAAWGIEYLHSKNVIHRDIAARNCLYGDGKVKISDFGLTREGTVFEMDPHQRVPIRWLAPETLRTAIYSQKTDCFAFGIMCWEILMHGTEPYPGMTVAEVNVKVKEGYRMPFPPETPPEMVTLITKHVWTEGSNDRWTMQQICKVLEQITHHPRTHLGGNVSGRQKSSDRRRDSTNTNREHGGESKGKRPRRRH